MSRATRRELFSLWDEVKRMNELLPKLYCGGRKQEVLELLTKSQERAIIIGNRIEAIYGEGLRCIHCLENYCETLFYMAENVDNVEIWMGVYELSVKQLNDIMMCMEQDMPDKLEVVILPYQVRMWDSLESIWLAAREDEECDVHVIPIPYYVKNTDGSLGQLKYEGALYPDYVPIIRFDEYDFETRHPDIIYIHNPYDNYNYVTAVPEYFYTSQLKKYTDILVYVPYFVLKEGGVEEQFVYLPGVWNADYVVVNDGKEQKTYVSMLRAKAPWLSEEELRRKILPLGNPKYDKLSSLDITARNIPKEWKKRCEGKTVVLYNTSVTSILHGNEKYVKKMNDVFDFFQNCENAILLWRPHPLLEDTLRVMRPKIYVEYLKAKIRFLKQDIGIFDDSADMYMAIGLSDMYYGDFSSIIWLYKDTGKRIIIQDIEALSSEKRRLWVTDLVENEDSIYLLVSELNSLFSYSKKTGKLRHLGILDEQLEKNFSTMALVDRKIYMASYKDGKILNYDLESQKCTTIFHNAYKREEQERWTAYDAVAVWETKLYFVGSYIPHVLCVDVNTGSVNVLTEWYDAYQRQKGEKIYPYIYKSICQIDNILWITMNQNNTIMSYDVETGTYVFYHVGDRECQYNTICFDGRMFWLCGNQEYIVKWNTKTNETEYYEQFPEGFGKCVEKKWMDELFSAAFPRGEDMYLSPASANMLVKVNVQTGKMKRVKYVKDEKDCIILKKIFGDGIYCVEQGGEGYVVEENDLCLPFGFFFEEDAEIIEEGTQQVKYEINVTHFKKSLSNVQRKNTTKSVCNGKKIYFFMKARK